MSFATELVNAYKQRDNNYQSWVSTFAGSSLLNSIKMAILNNVFDGNTHIVLTFKRDDYGDYYLYDRGMVTDEHFWQNMLSSFLSFGIRYLKEELGCHGEFLYSDDHISWVVLKITCPILQLHEIKEELK